MKNAGELIRLILRRERVRLPVWAAIFGVMPVAIAGAFRGLYPTEEALRQAAGTIASHPAFVALLGELNAPTLGGLTAWRGLVVLAVAVGLVSVLTVVRHTRAEEESGRRDLLASTVLGRDAPLAAAMLVVGGFNLAVAAITAGTLIGYGLEPAGSVALGASVALAGMVFAAVAAVAAQVTVTSRAANGIGLAVVGVSFMLRMVGDSGRGTGVEILAWLSPIGLASRARPFSGERWWVLALLALVGFGLVLTARAISRRRDIGAGVIAPGAGPPTASPSLAGPEWLAIRLQWGTAVGWLAGFVALGTMFGAVTESFVALIADTPTFAAVIANLGGANAVSDTFLGYMLSLLGVVAAAHGVQAALWLRAEELEARAEHVLTTSIGRPRWMSSHVGVALTVPVVDLLAGGAAAGLAYGLSIGEPGRAGRMAVAALVAVPAAWLMVGFALALFGLVPRRSQLAGSLVGLAGLLTILGRALGLDQWVMNLSPFTHTPQIPGGEATATPLVAMTAVAVVLGAIGYGAFNRRDVEGP